MSTENPYSVYESWNASDTHKTLWYRFAQTYGVPAWNQMTPKEQTVYIMESIEDSYWATYTNAMNRRGETYLHWYELSNKQKAAFRKLVNESPNLDEALDKAIAFKEFI